VNTTTNSLAVRDNGFAPHQPGALAIQDDQAQWTPMQLAALGQLGIKDAPDGDKQVFLHVSQRTGLDPFARQIYMIGRNEKKSEKRNGQWTETWSVKWTIQTGIDGWRVIRDRAERREGVRGILSRFTYYAPDGSAHPVWVHRDSPVAIEVTYTVRDRNGIETPYTSILRMDEYMQTKADKDGVAQPVAQWAVKDVHMLEKCTEADVYRKAFPQDYSGVVLDDAMPRADDAPSPPPVTPRATGEEIRARAAARQVVKAEVVETASREQVEQIWGHMDRLGHKPDKEWRLTVLSSLLGREVSSSASLTPADADRLIADLSQREPEDMAPARPAPKRQPPPEDPRDACIWHLDRLRVVAYGPQMTYLTRLAGEPVASPDSISAERAAGLAAILAGIETPDELEAEATRREQDAEGEAAGE
jgi:hypothetical protein